MLDPTNKVSEFVQKRVAEIKAMEGDTESIDSPKEYEELSNLLAGTTGRANQNFIKEEIIKYELNAKEQEENAFLEKVSEAVKEFVCKVKASFGEEDRIDSDAEAGALQAMLKNTNGDLSKEDIDYIHKELAKDGYDVNVPQTDDVQKSEQMSKGEVQKDEPKTNDIKDKSADEKEGPEIKNDNVPDEPVKKKEPPKTPVTKKPKNVSKPKKSEPNKKSSETEQKPKVLERDAINGTTKGRKFAEEINATFVNNRAVAALLRGVNKNNAYDFFQQYKAENNGNQNIVYKTLVDTSDRRDILDYRNFLTPVKALLMQAESYGLKDTPEYKDLDSLFKEMAKAVATPNTSLDPSANRANTIDIAINYLLGAMGRVVH